jgi:hypothetical protein
MNHPVQAEWDAYFGRKIGDVRPDGSTVTKRRVRGIFNASVACTSQCKTAHGLTCVCSCAGDNHGIMLE